MQVDIPVVVKRMRQSKYIRMRIGKAGEVLVTAPLFASERQIEEFIRGNEEWIRKQQKKRMEMQEKFPKVVVAEGAKCLYLGREVKFHFVPAKRIQVVGDTIHLPFGTDKEKLIAWLKRQAKLRTIARTDFYADKMGLSYEQLKVTGAKGKWGSCSSHRTIIFSWYLILCPPEAIDYVVVHELAHLREMNHSQAFWKLVREYYPDYVNQKAWLRKNAAIMNMWDD